MQDFIDSDINLKMLATKSFDHIIEEIQRSCLNFQLQISPFSAVISLKKSLIRDVTGKPLLPSKIKPEKYDPDSKDLDALVVKNLELEEELRCLSIKHEKTIQNLQKFHQEAEIKFESDSRSLYKELEKEIDKLKELLKNRDNEIISLQNGKKAAAEATGKLRKALGDIRVKFEKEKTSIKKEHRAEVKSWRQDLGNANSKIIKLEKKLEQQTSISKCQMKNTTNFKKHTSKSEVAKDQSEKENQNNIYCTICGLKISKHIPEYFLGEKFNPTCETCKACDISWDPDDPFASFPAFTQPTSLVSHWIPTPVNTPQRPGSIPSMLTHCALSPPPGSSFISMEEVLKMMEVFLKRPWFNLVDT